MRHGAERHALRAHLRGAVLARASKLVADAKRGIDVGRLQIAAGHTIVHAAVHDAHVYVEVLVEAVVGIERKRLKAAAASAMCNGHATGLASGAVGVLSI